MFCDRYLEMVKDRIAGDGDGADSARRTLWESLRVLLGLFAPFAPFVTEDLYQRFYAAAEGGTSLHLTRWPAADPAWGAGGTARAAVDQLTVILDATRVLRSARRLGNSARLSSLTVQAHKLSKSAQEKITKAGGKAELIGGGAAEPAQKQARGKEAAAKEAKQPKAGAKQQEAKPKKK